MIDFTQLDDAESIGVEIVQFRRLLLHCVK